MAADDTIRCPHATLPWRIAARKAGSTAKPPSNPTDGKITPLALGDFNFGAGFISAIIAIRPRRGESPRTFAMIAPRRSCFLGARLPAWYQTLHSPLF